VPDRPSIAGLVAAPQPVDRFRNVLHGMFGIQISTYMYGVIRTDVLRRTGLEGAYPSSYDDEDALFTPAWQERYTGIGRTTCIRFAREFARNAELTEGRSMVIVGASANHWYYNNLIYRSAITALILCGCCGRNGGGMNHYVGQEKLAPLAPWGTIALALDWQRPPRLQQSPVWHYSQGDQWRYEREFTEYGLTCPKPRWAKGHAIDLLAKAVRCGWMPMSPHFNRNPLEIVAEAERAGAKTESDIVGRGPLVFDDRTDSNVGPVFVVDPRRMHLMQRTCALG